MKRMTIKRVTRTEFETDDGRVFEHPVELDDVPTVEEFQSVYDKWFQVFKEMGVCCGDAINANKRRF